MPNVIHVEIRADVPHRAAQFYSAVLGLNVGKRQGREEQFVFHEGASSGSTKMTIGKRTNRDSVVPRFEVSSIDDTIRKIYQRGGKLVSKKRHVPGFGTLAYCHDTEGNTFSVIQREARR